MSVSIIYDSGYGHTKSKPRRLRKAFAKRLAPKPF